MTSLTPEQRVCDLVRVHPELRDVEGSIHGNLIDALAEMVAEAEREAALDALEAREARDALEAREAMREKCVETIIEKHRGVYGGANLKTEDTIAEIRALPVEDVRNKEVR